MTDKPRRSFSELPYSQQAALACNDPVFQRWLIGFLPDSGRPSRDAAVAVLRDRLGVESRSELDRSADKAAAWSRLWETFSRYTTTERYSAVRHG